MVDGLAGVPPGPVGTAPNLIPNGTFEAGLDGWAVSGGKLAWHHEASRAHTGQASARVTDRAATTDGATVDIGPRVVAGRGYDVSTWARIVGAPSDQVSLGATITCSGMPDVTVTLAAVAASRSAWTPLTGPLQVPACALGANVTLFIELSGSFVIPVVCELQDVVAYVEGPAPGIDMIVDDAAVEQLLWHPTTASVVSNPDFESGSAGWAPFGSGAMNASTTYAHSGSQSGVDSGRTAT